ncbi:MAG: peptidoglycan DD-metalloendopeptidase family protein [Ferruginibacter sp.]
MKYVLTITLLLFMNNLFSQTETEKYRSVSQMFEDNYNKEKYDSIFNLFSRELKAALPLDKAKEFLSGLYADAGKITNRKFQKYKQTYGLYKTNFERGLYSVNISVDEESKINGLLVTAFTDESLPAMKRNKTLLKLPFSGEWTIVWGGDTKKQNYHVDNKAQQNAFDIIITDKEGKSYKNNGSKNEDFYAFGKELLAPCNGIVVLVVDGIKDNQPGVLNPIYIPGNTVIIKTTNEEYLFFAHFKQNSIKVKEGQKVNQGQVLGLCGNSGNSSEAHIHFHIQNTEDMNIATGIKCYFDKLMVNGNYKEDYSPVQNDKIKNK